MTSKQFNKVLIGSLLALILLTGFSISSFGQSKKLVADETTLTQLKASVKVETSSERVFKLICADFTGEGFKYTVTIKRDRSGLYNQYSVSFKNDQLAKVEQFFVRINGKAK